MSLFSFGKPCESRALPFKDNLWPGIIFFAALSGAGLWYGGWWTWQNHLFADHGRQMQATLLRKYEAESQGKHGPVYTPHIAYGYQVGTLIVNCDSSVRRETWDQIGDTGGVPILYLPEDPSDSRINAFAENYMDLMKERLGLGGGFAALLFGVIATLTVSRRKKRVEKLRTAGLSTLGRVTAVDTERSGKTTVTFLRLEFTDNCGHNVLGRSLPLTRKQERLWTQGKSITVFYDPADSSVFTVNPNVEMSG